MSIQSIYTFNENDATNVYDYSTNGNNATGIANFSIVAGQIGYAGSFNGTSTDLNFGNILDFGGTDDMSIFCKLKVTTGAAHVIAFKSGQYTLGINASDKVTFTIATGGATFTAISSTSVVNDTWTTICVVYNGTTMYIYIDGDEDATKSQAGNLSASANDFHIGTDTSTYLNGRIEMISVYSQGLTAANVTALHDQPGGFRISMKSSSNFSNGDLAILTEKGTTAGAKGVITGDLGSNELLFLPIANDIPAAGDIMKFAGNVYNTARQWIFKQNIVGNKPYILIKDGISDFSSSTPDASSVIDLSGNTTRGFLPPKMTTAQMNAIGSPATGLIVYVTSTNKWMGYNGAWVEIG